MPQSTKEWVLNYTANRWGLNKKRRLGPTSDSIRLCQPDGKEMWIDYYYNNVRSREEIDELGRLLYQHICNDLPQEKRFHPDLLASVSEGDCIAYMHYLAIETPYVGYAREHGII